MAANDPILRGRLGVRTAIKQGGVAGGPGRDLRGRFTTFQDRLRTINGELAEGLAKEIAHQLEVNRIASRRAASSGRLEEAILDPRNRVATKDGFGVGVATIMTEDAEYWRVIDQGTRRFVGRRIRFIRNKGAGYGFPDPHGAGVRMANARNEYGQFRALAKQEATIKRPIIGENYFEKGVEAFALEEKVQEGLHKAWRTSE